MPAVGMTHLGQDVLIFDDIFICSEQDVEFPTSELRYECPSCCWRALEKEFQTEMLNQNMISRRREMVGVVINMEQLFQLQTGSKNICADGSSWIPSAVKE